MVDPLMTDSVHELRQEVKLLRQIIDGKYPDNVWWLMTKLDRQRKVLHHLHSEAYEQRQLRRAKALQEREGLALQANS